MVRGANPVNSTSTTVHASAAANIPTAAHAPSANGKPNDNASNETLDVPIPPTATPLPHKRTRGNNDDDDTRASSTPHPICAAWRELPTHSTLPLMPAMPLPRMPLLPTPLLSIHICRHPHTLKSAVVAVDLGVRSYERRRSGIVGVLGVTQH